MAVGAPVTARDAILDGRDRWDIGAAAGFAFGDAGVFAGSFLVAVEIDDVDDKASECRFTAVALELVEVAGFAVAAGVELEAAEGFIAADVAEVEEVAVLIGVVVVVARGTEDGPSDGRGPGVVVGFLTGAGWAVPFVRVVDDGADLACDEAPATLGRLVEASLVLGVSFVDAGLFVV